MEHYPKRHELISALSYTVTERIIESSEQKCKTYHYQLNLYSNRIDTATYSFAIENVFDISCKSFSGKYAILYLHTNQGVWPFNIQTDPTSFIDDYKKLRS